MSKPLRFFIAGIIQGSLPDAVHPQDYRSDIAVMLREAFPGSEVFDPVLEYPDSIAYDDARAGAAFFDLMDRAGRCDVLVAFVPEASMGTAIELWNAHHSGAYVVCVSGLRLNWVVRHLSDVVVEDLDGLKEIVANGFLARAITAKTEDGPARPPAPSSPIRATEAAKPTRDGGSPAVPDSFKVKGSPKAQETEPG